MLLIRATSVLPRAVPTMVSRAGMSARQVRSLHVENVVGHNMPFAYTNKRAFTLSYFTFVGTLLAAPFLVVKYQLIKSGH